MFAEIRSTPLNVDLSVMNKSLSSLVVRQNLKKLRGVKNSLSYNQFGSVTGRLTLDKNSFSHSQSSKKLQEGT